MYIPLFKIGRDRLPDLHLRVQLFYLAPSRIADTLAVHTGRNKKYLQVSPFPFDLQYHAADVLTVTNYTVGFSNLAHFSTVFRRYFGVAPSEYV